MPTIPKSKRPYWMPERKPFEGRRLEPWMVKFYNSKRWRGMSRRFLAKSPLCVECQKAGQTTAATHTDHINPIDKGGEWFDEANLQGLCLIHHNRKTAQSGGNATNKKAG